LLQSTRETLEDWLVGERTTGPPRLPIVAAVWATAPVTGFLGLVESDGEPRLLASLGGPASEDPAIVHAAVRCAAGNGAEVQPLALAAAMENVAAWMRRRRVAKAVGVERTTFRAVRRTMLERVARCVERAPRHRRAALVSLASTVRDALAGRLSAGAEQGLLTLSMEPLEDEAWLRALGAFCGLVFPAPGPADDATPHYGTSDAPPDDEDGIRVVILIRSGCAD
jgi:hypothetical protein